MNIAGVDIGISGAVVILTDKGEIAELVDMPVIQVNGKGEVDLVEVKNLLTFYQVNHVFIEKVHSMPGQGVVSTGRFMTVYGLIQGLCTGCSIPYTLIIPQRWKKAMLDGMGKDKGSSIIRVKQLYPDMKLIRKKDHNKADAVLIGLYGLREGKY